MKAAGDMIRKLRSEKLTLVQSVEKLCEAFIDLAYHDVTAFKKERGPVKLPSTCLLLKLHKLEMVAVPTVEIPVDPTCRYDNIISIDGFDSFFQLAGGVNLPKVMSCLGSDGKRRRQLVKVSEGTISLPLSLSLSLSPSLSLSHTHTHTCSQLIGTEIVSLFIDHAHFLCRVVTISVKML